MSKLRRTLLAPTVALFAFAVAAPTSAQTEAGSAEDASPTPALVLPGDADAGAAVGALAPSTEDGGAADPGGCQSDPLPAGHAVRVEPRVTRASRRGSDNNEQPVVGDRLLIVYRFVHQPADRVEFDPDPVAFSQPERELEYARQQPDRDRSQHSAGGGLVYGEYSVAVQPFKTGDVVLAPQLARLTTSTGEVVRVCTPAVRFRVRDPFGNRSAPVPHDLTTPETVREDSLRWRYVALGVDGAALLVTLTVFANEMLRRRPKPVVPPPPPRPAWIVALEQLDALAQSDLLSRGATKDYYDAISDIVRRYLGGTRGFDALEMTTDQVLHRLKRDPLQGVADAEIAHLLGECDLVKFARYVPTHEESEKVLESAYGLVRRSSAALATKAEKSVEKAEKTGKPVERTEKEKRA